MGRKRQPYSKPQPEQEHSSWGEAVGRSVCGEVFLHQSPHKPPGRRQAGVMERSHMNVMGMGEPSVICPVLKHMKEITVEGKPINVRNVTKPLVLRFHFRELPQGGALSV